MRKTLCNKGAFNGADYLVKVMDIFLFKFVDNDSAAGMDGNNPLGLKTDQGIGQRGATDSKFTADLFLIDDGTWKQFALVEFTKKISVDLVPKRSGETLFGGGRKSTLPTVPVSFFICSSCKVSMFVWGPMGDDAQLKHILKFLSR